MNHFNLPKSLPFRFVKNGNNGIHFDDQFACMQIRFFERNVTYKQKWVTTDQVTLQCESSIYPNPIELRNKYNSVLKDFDWDPVADGGTYRIFEVLLDFNDVDFSIDNLAYLYQSVGVNDEDSLVFWEYLSNPIWFASAWPHTNLVRYKNSFNRDDVAYTTGIEFLFRIECDIQDYVPASERNSYVNQIKSTALLEAFKGQLFQFYIGDAPGVAPYMIDILDYATLCDSLIIADKRYSVKSGSDWKISRTRGYPLIGASLDIVPYIIENSIQTVDTNPLPMGLVTAYNIETAFFGPKNILPVIEVEQNS